MKLSYKNQLALPDDISFNVIWEDDNKVDQAAVSNYVDSLKRRPGWYKDPKEQRLTRDTRVWMLQYAIKKGWFKTVTDPFKQSTLMRIFQCTSCQNGVSESGVDLGHIQDWRTHLKNAGVKTAAEAKAAYNNLNNLRLECRSCNASHDWEDDD